MTDFPAEPIPEEPRSDQEPEPQLTPTPGFVPAAVPAEDPEAVEDRLAFEDLTLGQVLGALIAHPAATGWRLWRVLTRSTGYTRTAELDTLDVWADNLADTAPHEIIFGADAIMTWLTVERRALWTPILVLAAAILMALRGGHVLQAAALDPFKHYARQTDDAGFWFMLAGAVYVAYVLSAARGWWAERFPRLVARLHALTGVASSGRWRVGFSLLAGCILLVAAVGVSGTFGTALLLVIAAALWLGAQVLAVPWPESVPDVTAADAAHPVEHAPAPRTLRAVSLAGLRDWLIQLTPQLMLITAAAILSLLAFTQNAQINVQGRVIDVVLTSGGVVAWALAVFTWVLVLGVDVRRLPQTAHDILHSNPDWGEKLANAARRIDAPLIALIGVTVFGLWFRLLDLGLTPPEMTSDHIEKLLDAIKVDNGYYAVFFANNGGREAFQMYVVAFIADTLGVGFNFDALKLATVIEGVITLPLTFWMAQQVIGTTTERERQLGRWIGVALAGLLAVNSWHLMLSRLGLRIVLTPLTTTLVIGFLARAMRYNRTRDYLALGGMLGAGFYFYQANRMLPLLVIAGVALAVLNTVRRWRDLLPLVGQMIVIGVVAAGPLALLMLGGDGALDLLPVIAAVWLGIVALWLRADRTPELRPEAWRIVGGLLVTIVVALTLYIPMYHYSRLYADQFWNRTQGRLFGENAFTRVNAEGVTVAYEPTLNEQFERFWDKRDVFIENYRDALRMWHWEGDAAWINNASARPALDSVAGGLLILGAVIWAVWALRRRDAVWWLLPVAVIIMLLPSALTLAYTIENPSFTRTSGTIPAIFMLAALPLGLLLWQVSRVPGRVIGVPVGGLVALALLAGVIGGSLDWNRDNFFTRYHLSYSNSWKPYREIAKPLRSFAEGEGSYGNAFVIAYPHWLDHRILGAMAGDIGWPNGVVARDQLLAKIASNAGTAYQYDPDKPLFVMYHAADEETAAYLQELFPGGEVRVYQYSWETGVDQVSFDQFYIYTVKAGEFTVQ